MRPGDTIAYRYCGREYTATVKGRYRLSVLRGSMASGYSYAAWELLCQVSFTTGSGRTHKKNVTVVDYRWRDEDSQRAALEMLESLGRDGIRVDFPQRGRDDYRQAMLAYQRGRAARKENT